MKVKLTIQRGHVSLSRAHDFSRLRPKDILGITKREYVGDDQHGTLVTNDYIITTIDSKNETATLEPIPTKVNPLDPKKYATSIPPTVVPKDNKEKAIILTKAELEKGMGATPPKPGETTESIQKR